MKSKRTAAAAAALVAAAAILVWIRFGPISPGLLSPKSESTVVVDRHGVVLYETLGPDGTRSSGITAAGIPLTVEHATLAAEDRRFYSHPGVDPIALGRAAWHDLLAMRAVEGGSTITQQVAKQLLGGHKRTIGLKIEETVLALRLEHRFTKREILAMYLNLAPYGQQYRGIARASKGYFGIEPSQLTVAQAAALAAMPQRPSVFASNSRALAARQREVLTRMKDAGFVTVEEFQQAKSERVETQLRRASTLAPHFVQAVLARFGDNPPRRIETTLDAELQRDVEGIIETHRRSLRAHGAKNVAVVVLDNDSGEWLAWEGSGSYFDDEASGKIDGVTTLRQPGSTMKPFTYACAFEHGFTPATVLADLPSQFPTSQEGIVYAPRNYDGQFRGPLRARMALAGSENVPAVALASEVGVSDLLAFYRAAGFTTFDKVADYYGLGLTLGNAEVRLDELVTAYAAFARGGSVVTPTSIRSVTGSDGKRAIRSVESAEQRHLVSPETAFWISDILSDSNAREWAFGSGGSLDFPFPVAVKTGTSQAYHDNWTIGFTRRVTVGVWVGNFDRRELRNSSGVTGAAPIFHDVMMAANARDRSTDSDVPANPPTLMRVPICSLSGLEASPECPAVEQEWLPADRKRKPCDWHMRRNGEVAVNWPAEYRSWARATRQAPSGTVQRASNRTGDRLRIESPAEGATYLIDPTLRSAFQVLRFRANADGEALKWSVDGRQISAASEAEWSLRAGAHVIRVEDSRGRSDETRIFVK